MEADSLEGFEIARRAAEAASDKLATDVVVLDVSQICSFADYFVICSGESNRQMRTIYEEIEHVLKREGVLPHHHEGRLDSGWLLIDYGDAVIHIFSPVERELYRLEELWKAATPVVRIQ